MPAPSGRRTNTGVNPIRTKLALLLAAQLRSGCAALTLGDDVPPNDPASPDTMKTTGDINWDKARAKTAETKEPTR